MPFALRLLATILALGSTLSSAASWAIGTPSGTAISNTAILQYTQSGTSRQVLSNAASFRVDEVVNVVVQKNDTDHVVVSSPDTRRVLTFTITNTGNGPQRFQLSVNAALPGSQFDPAAVRLAIDANANGLYEPGTDIDYLAGQNDPLIAPDRSLTVFVLSDIPAARVNNDVGLVALTVKVGGGTGAPGTVFPGRGAGGSDVVVGASGGLGNAQNGYLVSQLQPVLTKSQTFANASGALIPLPGSLVTYSLRLELKGSGTTVNGLVADTIPANTTYVPGSLKLDGAALTDRGDADAGRWNGNAVEVSLGSLVAPTTHVVSFQVRLN